MSHLTPCALHPSLQILATIIALFGFNGYDNPRDHIDSCIFCTLSSGGRHPFFHALKAPKAFTESIYTDSIMGCMCAPRLSRYLEPSRLDIAPLEAPCHVHASVL